MIAAAAIVFTVLGGRVAITYPMAAMLEALARGGYDGDRHREANVMLLEPRWRADLSPAARREIAYGWAEGLIFGGLGSKDALRLIRERDAPEGGLAGDIVPVDTLPTDRRHRNAWRRSPNGGPIYVCEATAARIDAERTVRAERARREKAEFEREVADILKHQQQQRT